jgi:hypothetical protein
VGNRGFAKKGHQQLAMTRLYRFGLTNDLGTSYVPMGSRHGGNPDEMTGEAQFQAPPLEASQFVFSWLGIEVQIPIV